MRSNRCARCLRAGRLSAMEQGDRLLSGCSWCYSNEMLQHLDIADGGTLDYADAFYDRVQADAYFERLKAVSPWQQERGRFGPFPRLTAWYADAGLSYAYSGVTHHAIAWTPLLEQIRRDCESVANSSFNSLLLNYYRSGQDSMGYHADDEKELGVNPVIASVSFGATRTFHLKHKESRARL